MNGTASSHPDRASSASAVRSIDYDINDPDSLNAGVNHFGSAFNFPEEFITVYRLHSLIPDLIEYRESRSRPTTIVQKVPVIETFRAQIDPALRERGMANWALSFGRQRLGLLTLGNASAVHAESRDANVCRARRSGSIWSHWI